MNHYHQLGLDPSADETTIRQVLSRQGAVWSKRVSAASTLEKRHEAERQLRLIADARHVLLDLGRRRKYDEGLANDAALPGVRTTELPSAPASSPPAPSDRRFWLGLLTGGLVVGAVTWWIATDTRPRETPPVAATIPVVSDNLPVAPIEASADIALEPVSEASAHAETVTPIPINLTARARATASSIKNEGGLRHVPARAIDGRMDTAWEEGAPGPGIGAWIELQLDRPYRLTQVAFVPGYAKRAPDAYGDRFPKNARVKRATVAWDGGEMQAFPADEPSMCRVNLPGTESHWVRIRIDDVRRGMWDDLCISEIEVWGY